MQKHILKFETARSVLALLEFIQWQDQIPV